MSYYLFVGSKNCSGFRKYGCGFCKIAYFRSDFERYSVLGICFWNPKQRRRSKKSSKVADSVTNMILACYGIRLQYSECCTVWPRNEPFAKKTIKQKLKICPTFSVIFFMRFHFIVLASVFMILETKTKT